MLAQKTFRLVLCSLCAGVLFTTACNEDDVLADVTCGDHVCNGDEDWSNCPADCAETCGNGICNSGENAQRCPGDCVADCGDGECGPDETEISCPVDCAGPLYLGPCSEETTGDLREDVLHGKYTYSFEGDNVFVDVLYTIADIRVRYTYLVGPENQLIRHAMDSGDDGESETDYDNGYFYDEQGRLSRVQLHSVEEAGVYSGETTYTYDATGYLVYSYQTAAEPPLTTAAVETTFEWNSDHSFRQELVDWAADTTVDATNDAAYNAEGNVTSRHYSLDGMTCTYSYDQEDLFTVAPAGWAIFPWYENDIRPRRLTRYNCEFEDPEGGFFYEYDQHGNLLSREYLTLYGSEVTTYDYSCW